MRQEFTQEIKNVIKGYFQDIHTVMPGKVVSFDPDTCEATISPIAKYRKPDGSLIDFPEISEVPVFFMQSAAQVASIVYPIRPDDECLLFVSEQALDQWRTGAESMTDLRFDISNAIAVVGFFAHPNPLVKRSHDNESIIIQCGDTFIELCDGTIKLNTTNTDVDKPTTDTTIDGKRNSIAHNMHNYETGTTTISISLDGQLGTIRMTTFNKDTGEVTGIFSMP